MALQEYISKWTQGKEIILRCVSAAKAENYFMLAQGLDVPMRKRSVEFLDFDMLETFACFVEWIVSGGSYIRLANGVMYDKKIYIYY